MESQDVRSNDESRAETIEPDENARAEKSLADIELEDTMRSIRGLGENADTVETTEADPE